jgi:hypothetical protein
MIAVFLVILPNLLLTSWTRAASTSMRARSGSGMHARRSSGHYEESSEISDLSAVDVVERELYGRGYDSSNKRRKEKRVRSIERKQTDPSRSRSGSRRSARQSRVQTESSSSLEDSDEGPSLRSRHKAKKTSKPTSKHRDRRRKKDEELTEVSGRRISRRPSNEDESSYYSYDDDAKFLDERSLCPPVLLLLRKLAALSLLKMQLYMHTG